MLLNRQYFKYVKKVNTEVQLISRIDESIILCSEILKRSAMCIAETAV